MDQARVSVVVPCFNSQEWLPETVASVFAQTWTRVQLVLVDDGSTDQTLALCEQLLHGKPADCGVVVSQPNEGLAGARNRGIAEATGRYVVPLDADDLLEPTMLEVCARALDETPDVDIVYTDRQDFGDSDTRWTPGTFELGRLKYFNQVHYCAMYRRSLWARLGGYRKNVTGFDDWDFWIAAAAAGARARYLAQPLFRHRRRKGSLLPRIVGDYEKLHATIMLNNAPVYSAEELEGARRVLDGTGDLPLIRAARFIFLSRNYPDVLKG